MIKDKEYHRRYFASNYARLRVYKTEWQRKKRASLFVRKYHESDERRIKRENSFQKFLQEYNQRKMYVEFMKLVKVNDWLDLYKSGLSTKEIAKKYRVTHQCITLHLRKYEPNYVKIYRRSVRVFIERNCKECDKTFSSYESSKRKYCSKLCWRKSNWLFDRPLVSLSKELRRKFDRERMKRYYRTAVGRANIKKTIRKSEEKNPERQRARVLLNWNVKQGKIKKPKQCQNCRQKKMRIVGHHPDYSKPLEVMWLCDLCHSKEHKKT